MELYDSKATGLEVCRDINIKGEYITTESSCDPTDTGGIKKRKHSFVWQYFRALENKSSRSVECTLCGSCVSKQTSNLARHLLAAHNINKYNQQGDEDTEIIARSTTLVRPSRSFIWKYCTKEDFRYARCHLCNKLLYFGGGNTANIAKHLRRKHSEVISTKELGPSKDMDDSDEGMAAISGIKMSSTMNSGDEEPEVKMHQDNNLDVLRLRKERKGSSYVWNYCDKLSRHTIRCKLCKKVMSFHGTANVITHLQRRHNIIGRVESDATILNNITDESNVMVDIKDDLEVVVRRRRRSSAATSIVWKYCTRLGQDVVRCSFCKKNLSFQGTSNLQRHLHRMHGIVTQGRGFSELDQESADLDDNFIWEHCEHTEDGKIKCSMCNNLFEEKDFDEVRKHLTLTHAILSNPPGERHRRYRRNPVPDETCDDTDEYDDNGNDNEDNKWQEVDEDFTIEYIESNVKKDQPSFDDIIEEDVGPKDCDEDPFDPNMMYSYPVARPLSGASSHEASPERTLKISADTNRLRRLNEERLRMETEYFREKASYYRMQKYLTALHAKKVRAELERLRNQDMNGTTYAVNADITDGQKSAVSMFDSQKN